MINIVVDTHLRIPNLSKEWKEGLSNLVSIRNESKDRAERELVFGAENLPDTISLARSGRKNLILPRGFLDEFLGILKDREIPAKIQDKREFHNGLVLNPLDHLSDDQELAVAEIVSRSQGRIIAPPGKGKTVIGLGAISRLKCPTLIIVEKTHIAKQWMERAEEHLGLEIGMIGDKEWTEKPISVATIQTLWSRREQLDEDGWWKYWSMILLDEQHHIPALTFMNIIQKFPAKYRIGLSATKGKSPEKDKVSQFVFGPTLYEDTKVKIKPKVHTIKTDFDFEYRNTRRIQGRTIRNNYQKMVDALTKDVRRNELISNLIIREQDKCNLILSRRLEHLGALRDLCANNGFSGNLYMLTGNESTEERMEIYKLADSANCAIFSTVADEALDIPRIDRIYLTFAAKNPETIWQQIGRGTRTHPDKESCIIYDFIDKNVSILYGQYQKRLRGLYQKKELEVISESNFS